MAVLRIARAAAAGVCGWLILFLSLCISSAQAQRYEVHGPIDPFFDDDERVDAIFIDDAVEPASANLGDSAAMPSAEYIDAIRPETDLFADDFFGGEPYCPDCGTPMTGGLWTWQILPDGLMYRSYLAGVKESRIASSWVHEKDMGWLWEATLGGRVGLLRLGTSDPFHPEGFQLDIEGAAFPRLDLDDGRDLISVDFRFGVPLTYRQGPWEAKFAYYHQSSHLGDEFIERNPMVTRINFSRDVLVLGGAIRPIESIRLYAEVGWAFFSDFSDPWEFQFGAEYSPTWSTDCCGAPFLAVGSHLREEVDFGGYLVVQVGWQWRGLGPGHLMRAGVEYLNGKGRQFQFLNEHEEQIGLGVWYDY